MSRRTLLGLWAHPDDEAYLSGGLMYQFASRGDRVVVVTATAGERGTAEPEAWPPARLAELRRTELAASLAALGVVEHEVLGYPDGGCTELDGTAEFATWIELVDPDVIVTFGPDGVTGHPDHRAVSQWATEAWMNTGSRAELWYATFTPEFYDRWDSVIAATGLFAEQPEPPCTPSAELAHHLSLAGRSLRAKLAALAAHASQTTALAEFVGPAVFREWWRNEAFVAAVPATVGAVRTAR